MGLYERALELAGLPTLAGGGSGWWGRQQVRDLCHLLAALANPRDEEALLGLLASPMVGLSSDALALLALDAREGGTTIWDGGPRGGARAGARGRPAAGRRSVPGSPTSASARRASGSTRSSSARCAAPATTCTCSRCRAARAGWPTSTSCCAWRPPTRRAAGATCAASSTCATAELEAEARETDAPVELGGLDAVRLMTIHAAKGLEFPVVVIADLGRRGNLSPPDLSSARIASACGSSASTRAKVTALDFDASRPSAAPPTRPRSGASCTSR